MTAKEKFEAVVDAIPDGPRFAYMTARAHWTLANRELTDTQWANAAASLQIAINNLSAAQAA